MIDHYAFWMYLGGFVGMLAALGVAFLLGGVPPLAGVVLGGTSTVAGMVLGGEYGIHRD